MQFKTGLYYNLRRSSALYPAIIAIAWLVLISMLHFYINGEKASVKTVKMGYMPVVSNLSAVILDYASRENKKIRFEAIKFSSFAEMAESLRNETIGAAFIIAPLSIVLRQQGEDVKVVLIGNRNESTLVARKGLNIKRLSDLNGRTIAVPMRYSGHNISLLKKMDEMGLNGNINVVEMNPPDMAAALSSGSLDAYFVGEPFAAQTVKADESEIVFYVEQIWENFICNLVLVNNRMVEQDPEAVEILVEGAARAGVWAKNNPEQASEIAARYWGQSTELVNYALTTPANRIVFDQFVPLQEELQHMANLMQRFSLLSKNDIKGLVEDRFALNANIRDVTTIETIVR